MVDGGMMSSGGMAMGGSARHLEVHVRSRATGKVLSTVKPSISLTDTSSASMMTDKVAVVAMQGVGEGVSDFHWGNDVSLVPGDVYKAVVKVNGQQATFTFKAS